MFSPFRVFVVIHKLFKTMCGRQIGFRPRCCEAVDTYEVSVCNASGNSQLSADFRAST
jgi:hypothetical protein